MSTCGTCRFWGGDETSYSGACGLGVALGAPTFDAPGCPQHQERAGAAVAPPERGPAPLTAAMPLYDELRRMRGLVAAEAAGGDGVAKLLRDMMPPLPGCNCPVCTAARGGLEQPHRALQWRGYSWQAEPPPFPTARDLAYIRAAVERERAGLLARAFEEAAYFDRISLPPQSRPRLRLEREVLDDAVVYRTRWEPAPPSPPRPDAWYGFETPDRPNDHIVMPSPPKLVAALRGLAVGTHRLYDPASDRVFTITVTDASSKLAP